MRLPLATVLLSLAACSGSSVPLTGRVAPGFPSTITTVEVTSGGAVVASAPVASDGSFSIGVPAGVPVALQFSGDGDVGLVFPRLTGAIDSEFTLDAGTGAFDLGFVRFVGTASSTRFVFHTTTGSGSGGHCDADGHDGSGATCVDDDDGMCGPDHHGDGDHDGMGSGDHDGSGSGSDGTCTHHMGGMGDGDGDGSGSDSDAGSGAPHHHHHHHDGDAVADHNIPNCGHHHHHHHGDGRH